jgi:excisionase family DNA binding protein
MEDHMPTPTGQPASGGAPQLLERLATKVDSVESTLSQVAQRLDALHELLTSHRKDHLLVEEVAELTGRSAYTVRRWIAEGKLHAIRLRDGGPRGKLLIPRGELERLIATGKGGDMPDIITS